MSRQHICIECDQQCVMHSDDWHECHMTPRCDCGAWGICEVENLSGEPVNVCPSCADDLKEYVRDALAAKRHGVPYSYYLRGISPRDFV